MKLAMLAVLGALLGGCACGPATGAVPCSPDAPYRPSAAVVDVDGQSYVDHGVYYGPAPDDTVIPQADPPVGQLRPSHALTQSQSIYMKPDAR